jgi:hypothetical protein
VRGIARQRALQYLHAHALRVHAAAGAVRERDHAVDIRVVGQRLRVGLAREVVGNGARGRGRAVHAGQHADVVARGHAAVGAPDAHEGGLAWGGRGLHVGAEGVVALEPFGDGALVRAHVQVLRVHVLARGNGLARETDDLVVAAHRLAGGDGAHRDLVARRNEAAHGHAFDGGAAEHLGARDDDVVGGVESDVGGHGGNSLAVWLAVWLACCEAGAAQVALARRQLALNLWWNLSMCWCMASRAAARVARGNGVEDGFVLADGGLPRAHGLEVIDHPREDRPVPRLPEALHRLGQHHVVAGVDDGQVEGAVAFVRHLVARGHLAHRADRAAHGVHVLALAVLRGGGGGLALDHAARANDLQRAPFGAGAVHVPIHSGRRRAVRAVEHVHARAGADLHPAFHLQRNQRLAHRRPAHAQLLGQVALGGNARAHRELALADEHAQLFGNLAVEALGFEGLDRHELTTKEKRKREG